MEVLKICKNNDTTTIIAVYPHKDAMKVGSLNSLKLKIPKLKPCKTAIKK